MSTYRKCAVPMCRNTTTICPKKLFIHVPKCIKRRKQWMDLARRDPKSTSIKSVLFFCEDHFDLPNDMENYTEFRIMGSVRQIRMKPDCLPSKFECQPDRIKRTAPPLPRSAVCKRRRMDVLKDIIMGTEVPAISGMTSNSDFQLTIEKDNCSMSSKDQAIQVSSEATNKLVQVCLTSKVRSKTTQTTRQSKDITTSPIKANITCTATSPFKTMKSGVESARFENTKSKRKLLFTTEVKMLSSNSSSPSKNSQSNTGTSPSVQSLFTMTSTSSDQETQSELTELRRKVKAENLCQIALENTVRLIINNPRYYIGITKECYFFIDIIQEYIKHPNEHILLCLKKIRLNTPFSELGDQFGMWQNVHQ